MADLHAETVAQILERAARTAPDVPAVVAPAGETLSYAELVDCGRRLGRWLLDRGLTPGDRVALWTGDVPEHIAVYAACALAGLVVVPMNSRFTEHEAQHVVTDSGARILLHDATTAERVRSLAALIPDLPEVPITSRAAVDALVRGVASGPLPPVEPEMVLVIGYTSGTTGRPKGAVLTQRSVAALARMNALSFRLPIASVCVLTGSMSFVAVVPAHVISHFYMRGTVVLLGERTVAALLDAVERHRATFTYVPSPFIDEFAEAAKHAPERWSSLVSILHSASKASPEKLERLAEVVGGRLVEGWGMTENSGGLMTATTPRDAQPGSGRLATVGRPVPGVEVEVVDVDGVPVTHDGRSLGELVFRSPALMSGYWCMPQETSRVFVDGWFHTGDLGTIDPNGYVTLTERRVDLIVSGGMNVYPSEVEAVLMRHDDVEACCVVGVPHERWGQGVVAVVVRRAGSCIREDELVAHCRIYLASFKKPTMVRFVDALPTTPSLKVSRAKVREMLTIEY